MTSQSSPMQAYNQAINDLDKELDHLKNEPVGGGAFQILDKMEGSIVGFGNGIEVIGSGGGGGKGKRGRGVLVESRIWSTVLENVEILCYFHKLIQDSKDEPSKLATKLYVILQHMKSSNIKVKYGLRSPIGPSIARHEYYQGVGTHWGSQSFDHGNPSSSDTRKGKMNKTETSGLANYNMVPSSGQIEHFPSSPGNMRSMHRSRQDGQNVTENLDSTNMQETGKEEDEIDRALLWKKFTGFTFSVRI
ncbi:hypothetical protein F3Y22_tig00117016pilonHSYRG00515 [Hibiscus syriacus]|uniref:Uncharacterized protein n=1 Tax=Hibiscus syriacus TaxID=106335 RepID=A0A6A2X209_HIBSY|nr:hypothetical protein F3Y22_tig00117016pilonHSYRG00515 [Hibiscus syriacus]